MEPSISVVVPVWDGEALLGPLVGMLERAAEGMEPGSWECVLVDDGSSDGTWAEASRLAEARPWLRPPPRAARRARGRPEPRGVAR